MDDLVTWLRAQLDDDERVARSAASFPYELPGDAPWERERIVAERVGGKSRAVNTHRIVAIFADPARVLAEVAAKQRRIDELVMMTYDDPADETASFLLRLETQPFADRPGYRPEWAPDADPTVG